MESSQIGFRLPLPLKTQATARAHELNYRSLSDYIVGLVRYDLMVGKPHTVTAPLSHEAADVQAAADRGILQAREQGTAKGSYLDHLVEELFTEGGPR